MIGSILLRALNIPALLRHRREAERKRHSVGVELELQLYATMFESDFLHAGYFRNIPIDPQDISLRMVTEVMQAYTDLVVERIAPGQRVLDIGCGLGGLLRMLRERGIDATGLTPSAAHAESIRRRVPGVPVIVGSFEALDPASYRHAFDVAVSMESFHNVPLDAGLRNMREVVKPGGKWIVVDYYRLHEKTYNRSGHLLTAFREAISRHGLRVIEELDISENTVPTLAYAHCFASRIGLPLLDFGAARFFRKHPVLEYLLQDAFAEARGRLRLDALDPKVAERDKRYFLHQLAV